MRHKNTRINISMSENMLEKAKERADFFGGNFSAYIAHLIANDIEKNPRTYTSKTKRENKTKLLQEK